MKKTTTTHQTTKKRIRNTPAKDGTLKAFQSRSYKPALKEETPNPTKTASPFRNFLGKKQATLRLNPNQNKETLQTGRSSHKIKGLDDIMSEERISSIQAKFDRIDVKLDAISNDIHKLTHNLDNLSNRVVTLENKIDHFENKFTHIENRIDHIEGTLSKMPSTATIISTAISTSFALLTIGVAILAFAGDRFDSGLSLSTMKSEQAERLAQQDNLIRSIDEKFYQLLKIVSPQSEGKAL